MASKWAIEFNSYIVLVGSWLFYTWSIKTKQNKNKRKKKSTSIWLQVKRAWSQIRYIFRNPLGTSTTKNQTNLHTLFKMWMSHSFRMIWMITIFIIMWFERQREREKKKFVQWNFVTKHWIWVLKLIFIGQIHVM